MGRVAGVPRLVGLLHYSIEQVVCVWLIILGQTTHLLVSHSCLCPF